MFFLGLPLAEKILRPVIVYVFLVVGLRVAGKRELGQLNPFDLVVLLTILYSPQPVLSTIPVPPPMAWASQLVPTTLVQ